MVKMKKQENEIETSGRTRKLVLVIIAVAIILVPAIFFFSSSPSPPIQPKAAIIDQLSSSSLLAGFTRLPNQTFIKTAKELLYERFSQVDYYQDNATVNQYAHLPSAGYKLIVWRAHSALDSRSNYVAISTSEIYYGQRDYDQYLENEQLTLCNMTLLFDQNFYLAITPKFVDEVMSGRFEDTVIILMSCNGLKQYYEKTAKAFEEKGAKVFISWDGWIDSLDNDNAVTLLLQYLIDGNNTVSGAVNKIGGYYTKYQVYLTYLRYDPFPEVGDYSIPNYRQSSVAGVAGFVTKVVFRKNADS